MEVKKERIKVVTSEFRVSFPTVFEAKKVNADDAKAKFSIQMLFRVKDTKESLALGEEAVDISPLKNAVKAVLVEKFGPDQTKWPAFKKSDGSTAIRLPFRDGNEVEKKGQAGFGEGVIFCSASSTMKPGLIDGQKNAILMPNEFYGGCYARATLNPYWYEVKGNKGVAWGLLNIQKLRDGDPFSGRMKAEDEFDAIALPEGAVAAGAASNGGDPLGL